jgi:hypothetical protein
MTRNLKLRALWARYAFFEECVRGRAELAESNRLELTFDLDCP